MTPINGQFNTALLMMNALGSFSSNSSSSYASSSIFGCGSAFNAFNSFNEFNTPSVFNANLNILSLLNSFNYQPSFNFNFFSAPAATQVPSFNFNFGSFGTNVAAHRSVRLTSDKAQNAVSLATSQIGVRENGSSNDSIEVRKYKNGARNSNAWCASFVSWCYGRGQNNNNAKTFGYDQSTQSIRAKAMNAGHYSSKNSSYVPQVGDLAIWRYSSSTGHVGIISKVNPDGSFETIEGNCDNKVQRVTRTRNGKDFDGFVRMNEWLEA